jgi:hypothetical protein
LGHCSENKADGGRFSFCFLCGEISKIAAFGAFLKKTVEMVKKND